MINFTVVYHPARIKLGLTNNEYCLADTIYHLSNHPENKQSGWCYATMEKKAEMLGVTKMTINSLQKILEEKGIIEKNLIGQTRTTEKWYMEVILSSKDTLPESKETIPSTVKEVYQESKDTLLNIYTNINSDKDKDNTPKVFIDEFFHRYQKRFNIKYHVNGAKDGAIAKKLLKSFKIEELDILMTKFFNSDDKFYEKAGYTIGVFYSAINKLQTMKGSGSLIDRERKIGGHHAPKPLV